MLVAEGYSFADFPSMEQLTDIDESEDDILLEQILETGLQKYRQLNDKQKEIVDIIINAERNNTGNKCFYINGPGGTGKTFVYTTLWYLLKGRKKCVNTMAYKIGRAHV